MSQEPQEINDDEERVIPSSSTDAVIRPAPTLGRYYEDAEKQLGPEAPHFDVVKRALHLWEQDVKENERHHEDRPGSGAQ